MKYRIGWSKKDGGSANEITGPHKDGKRGPVLAIRWGCSCCRNSADSIDDLEPEEKKLAEEVVEFLNSRRSKKAASADNRGEK